MKLLIKLKPAFLEILMRVCMLRAEAILYAEVYSEIIWLV